MKYFTKSHEWIEVIGEVGTVGITEYAKDQLGDIVYVEFPQVGKEVNFGEAVCVIESTKAASDVYSPASGKVTEVNDKLLATNWLYKIKLSTTKTLTTLMTEPDYKKFIAGS